jgi:hypothetical protein
MKDAYKKQVSLLLEILPEVAKEDVFALHGGTAINLFCLNMPRLSVDIDLTYVPASDSRDADLRNIRLVLERIKERLRKQIPAISFTIPDSGFPLAVADFCHRFHPSPTFFLKFQVFPNFV